MSLSREQVDRMCDEITETARDWGAGSGSPNLWERVRTILRQWTGT